jgi:hypothetical protein
MNRSRRPKPVRRYLAATAACLAAAAANGQAPATEDLPLFRDDTALELTLEAPLRTLSRNTRSRKQRDALVHLTQPSGETITLDVRVRIRGNSRLAECDFPPLRLNFRRSQLEGTVFAGQNRLKLVTLCKRIDRYRDYLALEHDIYRLFNELTDASFRVRRATVRYVSTDARRPEEFTEPAFFIEEDWEVAARHGVEVIETERLDLAELDPRHTNLLSLFHFAIGNTDWSAIRGPDDDACCHNGKVIGLPGNPAFVIPYDFDQSGLINTDYSAPSDLLPIRRVTQRLYRGFCAFDAEIAPERARMIAQRSALESVLRQSTASSAAIEQSLEFLSESFAVLEDDESFDKEIVQRCRG